MIISPRLVPRKRCVLMPPTKGEFTCNTHHAPRTTQQQGDQGLHCPLQHFAKWQRLSRGELLQLGSSTRCSVFSRVPSEIAHPSLLVQHHRTTVSYNTVLCITGIYQAKAPNKPTYPSLNLQPKHKMENAGTARGPFDQSAYPQPDIKARFYRYFQEEVTGTASLFSQCQSLI